MERGWKVERRKEAQEGKEESEIDSTTLKEMLCVYQKHSIISRSLRQPHI